VKRSLDDTAERFDAMSASYDEDRSLQQRYTPIRVTEAALGLADTDDLVVDVGTGTGTVALHVAPHVGEVVGLDVSEGMLGRAREKAEEAGVGAEEAGIGTEETAIGNVRFAEGRFRDIEASVALDDVDLVTSNFAMHHLSDEEKREAVDEIARVLAPDGAVVIGDLVIFGDPVDAGHYDPDVDDPSTAAHLERIFRDAGFDVTVTRLDAMIGLVVARR
jgi:ubiquinone/menaquinone biosynthesis C-methylase UbiE